VTRERVTHVVVLAIAAAVLGVWGYTRVPGLDLSATDTAYKTLQLFSAEADIPAGSPPWQLEIARFLAPLAVAYAVLVTILALARDQVQHWRSRIFARRHVLIVGAGAEARQLARALRGRHRVVMQAPVADEARDPGALRAARPERAAHVVVMSGSDSTNLEVLAALRGVIRPRRPVAIHVAIDAPRLWSELHRLPFQSPAAQRRVEFVNLPDRTARLLVDSIAADGRVEGRAHRVLIRGAGPTVARLAVHLMRSLAVEQVTEAVIEGADVKENLRLLRATDGWIFERATIRADADTEPKAHGASMAFVCGLPDTDALEAALMLARRVDRTAPIHVAVPDAGVGAALEAAGVDMSRITLVATGEALLDQDLLAGAAFEVIARGKHADYVRRELARGTNPDENEALRPWEELDEVYRESNRRFADGVASVLAGLGAELVPLAGREVGAALPAVANDLLEELAIREHDRWVRDQLRDGWRPTTGPRDSARRLHPLLVPWEQLGEAEREKDRDAIRALPALFASLGYELVVPGAPS
jgi:hypothetical protein